MAAIVDDTCEIEKTKEKIKTKSYRVLYYTSFQDLKSVGPDFTQQDNI